MSNKPPRNTYTPLAEVGSSDNNVVIGSIVPQYINARRIGIDLEALDRICRISGIARISIMNAKRGGDEMFQIGSIDSSGNASAGISLGAVKSKDISKRKTVDDTRTPRIYKSERSLSLHLDVDIEIMAKELLERRALGSVSAWAEILNENITPRVLNQASLSLLTPDIMDVAISVANIANTAKYFPQGSEHMAQFIAECLRNEVALSMIKSILPVFRRGESGRFDFSPFGIEIFRLLMIQAIRLQNHKLISEIIDIDE